ncbi:MAG: SDR family NAD(P)-dependent oxidoreductase [Candidatus Margulisbacteria bacterium]|nr:SDR family NAD(P)-dependent oxidoreductase [Candidatus Margulisiibacteriota bacterium]
MKKVVFITGGSSGLGLGLAQKFVSQGYDVMVGARRALFGDIASVVCDVRDKESVRAAVLACVEKFGRIDIAIANAGVSSPSPADQLDSQTVEESFQTNVMGAVYLFEAVLPDMLARGDGQLVSIASLAGYRGLPGAGAYCGSKAALMALTESFRIDLRKSGVAVSVINPGFIKTPMTDRNQYSMPFLLTLDDGVTRIFKAIILRKKLYSFPFRLAIIVRIGRLLPAWLYDALIGHRKNIKQV